MIQPGKDNRTMGRRALLQNAAAVAGAGLVSSLTTEAAGAPARSTRSPEEPLIVAASSRPVVETTAGKVRGYSARGILTFKGIPYAGSTAGPNRFMPPAKPKPWSGIRSSMYYGQVCPQGARNGWKNDEESFMFEWDDGQPGEDHLRVNVWTPAADNRKRPVMVWLHGGGFSAGSGQELESLRRREHRPPRRCRARQPESPAEHLWIPQPVQVRRRIRKLRECGHAGSGGCRSNGFATTSQFRRRPGQCDDLRSVRRRKQGQHADGHARRERPLPQSGDRKRLIAASKHAGGF